MKRRLALVAVAATALAGCMWLGQPAAVEPVAPPGPAGAGAGNADPSGLGTLRIRVKWPARDLPNFHAQVIPLWSQGKVAFGVYAPSEAERGKPPVYTPEGAAKVAGQNSPPRSS